MTQPRSPVPILAGAFLALSGIASASPGIAVAQERDVVRITARILDVDTRAELEGAVIALSGVANRYVTGPDGRVSFDAAVGEYTLTIRKGGYATVEGDFSVFRPGDFSLMLRRAEHGDLSIPARLLVKVVDAVAGTPVEGATVSLVGGQMAPTNPDGRVEFTGLASELTQVTVDRIGYATRTEPITLHPDLTTAVEVALTVEAVALRPIKVEVRSRFLESHGYYRRLDQGVVMRMLTRQSIEERGSPLISDAFARVPGLRIERPTNQRALLRARDCMLAVFVDGVEWGVDIEGTVNIDQIPPEWVEVAEVYWGSRTPPEYRSRHNGGCGSALIWTRQAVGGN